MPANTQPVDRPRETWSARWRSLHPRHFFGDTWRKVDREASEARSQASGLDHRPWLAFSVGGLCLIAMEYLGSDYHFADLVMWLVTTYHRLGGAEAEPAQVAAFELTWTLRASPFFQLYQLGYWAVWRVLGYFVVPALLIRTVFRQPLREYGLRIQNQASHAWLYALCIVVMLPVVAVMSQRQDFAQYYPFYKQAGRSWAELIVWQGLYAAQFFALEFFFRGFWLFASKATMGSGSIAAMLVPYSMIHFGKPWPEAVAAIAAGLVLGTLALRTGSIWGGVLVHVTVATSMDLAALLQGGGLPGSFWPAP